MSPAERRTLLDEVQTAYQEDKFTEAMFQRCICAVFDYYDVTYQTEYAVGPADRRCDIYVKATDTAIELKREANLTGVGQAAYYANFCDEAMLIADGDPITNGHNDAAETAAASVPDVKYGLAVTGVAESPPRMSIITEDSGGFISAAAADNIGDGEFLVVKQDEVLSE